MTSVEAAIRKQLTPGTRLPTPTGRSTFEISEMTADSLILLFGPKKTRTPISWACLEGIPDYLRGRQWIRIGANRDVQGDQDALDGYLKGFIKRQTADYIAVVLEQAGVVELDRTRPARLRLRPCRPEPGTSLSAAEEDGRLAGSTESLTQGGPPQLARFNDGRQAVDSAR
ncbi:hypothetical protein [Actinoplanes sp. NPDC026670]|uniref:hypothetical protein n=1 Tax=Actinoplanes sp. NPDC026670 TaxID=3154700 RepID=UPI0033E037FE